MAIGARVGGSRRLTGWRRHGSAGVARVYRSSTLHGYGAPFLEVFLPMEPWRHGDLTWAILGWRQSTKKGRTMAAMSSLTSAAVGAGSTNQTVLETGKMGVVALVGDRWGVGSTRAAP
jgi:hypothetical protein